MLVWAGNAVAARWAPGQVSPQALTTLRWFFPCVILAAIARRHVMADRETLRRHWGRILAMGAIGYTVYASLFYAAGAYTGAVNIALLQGAIPVLVLILNFLAYRQPVSWGQGLGVGITLVGTGVAASHGDLDILRTLAFNRGDVLMLVACLLYAGYTVALATRPKVSALAFFAALAGAAFVTSLPPLAAEWAAGRLLWPTAAGWAIVTYVALGPSLAAQLTFLTAVEMIGPNRAGLFVNLVPIFGAGLAVLILGEPFDGADALALALVLGGIACAERLRPRGAPPVLPPEEIVTPRPQSGAHGDRG
ncbi:DMT family transporter [Methylobacterium radiodurans]|uniref:EamA family transporter n=1 Tax=Methylobacterium radiodurans TaxID=2202828 RepID=A0A2U8VPC7_9HYPH|nr:DMT family transporter [Methylobacterium radiodurans]AWN35463.1 EamA family transporter [Methylobacterium radiodurans]